MAEVTAKTLQELAPNLPGTPVRLVYVKGTTAATGDTLTVSDLTTVIGAYLSQANGTLPTSIGLATNVITINNAGGALTYSGLAWGT
jgi:hypothetical protein